MMVEGRILHFKGHTDAFCKSTMKHTIDVQRKVINDLQASILEYSRVHVQLPPSRASMVNDYDPFDPDDH